MRIITHASSSSFPPRLLPHITWSIPLTQSCERETLMLTAKCLQYPSARSNKEEVESRGISFE